MLQSSPTEKLVLPIASLAREDVSLAGGKGANLGELTRAGILVPPGFVVTVGAYDRFLEEAGVRPQAEALLGNLDVDDGAAMERVAAATRDLITAAPMPEPIADAIADAYRQSGEGPVAVRSSATAEDLAEASFAGQQETYLNVEGGADVLHAVQKCWASLFEARAVHYRATTGFGQLDVKIAVVVQRMVQSDRSGVMFTVNPVTTDEGQILIEAVYGLGEGVVSGVLTPDMYVVDKASGALVDCQITPQVQELVRRQGAGPGEEPNQWAPVDWGRRAGQKLSAEEIAALAVMGSSLERHFGCPQDIEWAAESGTLYIVQARPVTGLK
jgi:pyruvate, water dikinase